MKINSIGPQEKHKLEVWEACLKRAERRIMYGWRLTSMRPPDISRFHRQRPWIEHIAACLRARGTMRYAGSLAALRAKRSQIAIRLVKL